MIRLTRIKSLAIKTGLYQLARFLQRHVLHRNQLITFRRDLQFFSSIVSPGSLCFDVGANIGDKTEVLLRLGAQVVAFEPQLNCLHELKVRCERLGRLTTIGAALGSKSAIATMHVQEGHGNSSLLEDWGTGAVACSDVPVITLDAALVRYGIPDYCKIDVEGWELEVLLGLSHPIPLISFEYHAAPREIKNTLAALN